MKNNLIQLNQYDANEYYSQSCKELERLKLLTDIRGAAVLFSVATLALVFFRVVFALHGVIQAAVVSLFM